MKKKVSVSQLEPGMYVSDFNNGWNEDARSGKDPNGLPQQMMLKSDADVRRVLADSTIREVYIDTERGRDVEGAKSQAEIEAELAAQMMELGEEGNAVKLPNPDVKKQPMEQELEHAHEVKQKARRLVGDMLDDVRLGKTITVGPVKELMKDMVESMFSNKDAMLSLSMIKAKDEYTFMHSVNVGVFLVAFAQSMEMTPEELVAVGVGAMLHDIGKMKTPQEVLNKPGKLDDEEFLQMKMHVVHSEKILAAAPGISELSVQIAGRHHERWDGSGYPRQLKGHAIGQMGQMSAIVDVYDAITSDRCYHKGNSPHQALKRMMEWSKFHFNPDLFQKFVQCVGIYPMGTLVRLHNGYLGVVLETNTESLLHPVVRVLIDSKAKKKLKPVTLNLIERKADKNWAVEGVEDARKWGVDPKKHMPKPELFQ
ncbi:metal dependent phosphohydrolase [Magnetococcus marinus MC-1]|uniref:Metal dependent phosphohydrolase n=1 Tax=Magnetococcus marinus (strain ATCC BAA-1437 / JCM 17883 / MC-1) TaxID=156889 RepID=A0L4B3_MAGMM|nr:HD-GYP domain-containing protein [Magnetococcus marinus]ABK42806.1 metal dependent phosphohydrolase [Magnetococcus marinus MC-1]